MAGLSLTIDMKPTAEAFRALGRRAPIAIARGINRTATSERAAMASAVAKDMGLKVGTVKDAISIQKATATSLSAFVTAKGKRIALIDFGAKGPEPSHGRGRGVSARMPGGKGRYPNAFIATMGTGHRGVFQRRGTPRLPIYELFGPSITHVFALFIPLGEARRTEMLFKNVQHELSFALTRAS